LRRQVREALGTPVGWLVVAGVACFLFDPRRAHRSRPVVYDEQMREWMRATNQLWETDADLEAAERLFEPDDTRIREGITRIIDFLGELTNEYEQCVDDLSSDDGSGTTLEKGPQRPHMLPRCEDGGTSATRHEHRCRRSTTFTLPRLMP
jgi:hypothetical protein